MTAPLHDDGAAEPQDGARPGRGAFAVLPQALGSRAARRPVAVVAVAVVAVVGLAVVGGQLGDRGRPTGPAEVEASVARIIQRRPRRAP